MVLQAQRAINGKRFMAPVSDSSSPIGEIIHLRLFTEPSAYGLKGEVNQSLCLLFGMEAAWSRGASGRSDWILNFDYRRDFSYSWDLNKKDGKYQLQDTSQAEAEQASVNQDVSYESSCCLNAPFNG